MAEGHDGYGALKLRRPSSATTEEADDLQQVIDVDQSVAIDIRGACASIEGADNPIVNAMIRQLKTAAGKDHVSLSVTMEEETSSALYRFQLEEGVIKAIGAGVQAGIGGGLGF